MWTGLSGWWAFYVDVRQIICNWLERTFINRDTNFFRNIIFRRISNHLQYYSIDNLFKLIHIVLCDFLFFSIVNIGTADVINVFNKPF